ncbi:MAG TPA: SufD family Fe-S cluster assembly protein [Candidatus Peribacteraceae bacterium]|nr:SufD family Fe-S cluster assembly protein [Candidatus Peribacteraceae bacterium]
MSAEQLIVPAGARIQDELSIGSGSLDVRVEKNAELLLIVRIEGGGQITSSMTVAVEDGARCTVLTINAADADAAVSISQRGEVGENATLTWQNVTLGGGKVEQDLVSHVSGDNAVSSIDWMFYAKKSETQHLTVRNVFDGRSGAGEILMRGVAEDKAHADAEGMIEIGLHGGGTNTYLTQNVLMLDPTSKVDAVPGLEIKTNDVKASHSATVSRLTAEDLFYFASRSIPPVEARAMYVQGFLGDITQRIVDEKRREEIVGLVERKYSEK